MVELEGGAAHRWCAAPVCVVARRRGVPGLPARSSHAPLRGAGPVYVEIAPLRGAGPSRPLVARAASVARRVASKPGLKDKTCWFVATFWFVGVGKSVLEVVVSLRACTLSLGGRDAAPRVGACFIVSLCVAP